MALAIPFPLLTDSDPSIGGSALRGMKYEEKMESSKKFFQQAL